MAFLAPGGRASGRHGPWLVRLYLSGLCLACTPAAQAGLTTPRPPSSAATSSPLSLPSDFVPLPGTIAFERGQQQRQLAGLLRDFDGVLSAQALIVGEADGPRVSILLKLRPRTRMDTALVEAMASVALSAVPGLTPEALTVATTTGQRLYGNGTPQVTDPPRTERDVGLPLAPVLASAGLAAVAAVWFLRHRRKPSSEPGTGEFDFLAALRDRELDRVFGGERAELVALVTAACDEPTARRLRRYARARGLGLLPPLRPLAAEVGQVVASALRAKAGRGPAEVGREAGEA